MSYICDTCARDESCNIPECGKSVKTWCKDYVFSQKKENDLIKKEKLNKK